MRPISTNQQLHRRLRAGDRVQLRSPREILATLDERGCLDGLPFMPEMLEFFGPVTYRVEAQVERACDTIDYSGVRRLRDTVVLGDLRCDGSGHAGCQAQCRLYWKEAWLRVIPTGIGDDQSDHDAEELGALEQIATASVRESTSETSVFRCQATELVRASEPVGWWNLRSIIRELTNGNVRVGRFIRVVARIVSDEVARRIGLLPEMPLRSSAAQPSVSGPQTLRGLDPGQLVQIRSRSEIARTLDDRGKNRGLWFDREMKPYCGQTARVKSKVERFIDERTGKLVELASDCYILDDVVCDSARSNGRWFCPRAIYPWWREAWLKPVDQRQMDTL